MPGCLLNKIAIYLLGLGLPGKVNRREHICLCVVSTTRLPCRERELKRKQAMRIESRATDCRVYGELAVSLPLQRRMRQ